MVSVIRVDNIKKLEPLNLMTAIAEHLQPDVVDVKERTIRSYTLYHI